jgi:glutamate racemase
MSDSRPIGILDSGLGGLIVAKEINQELPWESSIYVADTAGMPFGNRSPEAIISTSRQLVRFLISQNVKAIVVASATSSSVALDQLVIEFPHIPILGVISPTVREALKITNNGEISIIGTRGAINNRAYENAIEKIVNRDGSSRFKAIITHASPCPLFAPIIEEGILSGPIIEEVVNYYLKDLKKNNSDTLILGCAHFSLIAPIISNYLPHIRLVSIGAVMAKNLKQELTQKKLTNQHKDTPDHAFFATDVTDNFIRVSNLFLGQPISVDLVSL